MKEICAADKCTGCGVCAGVCPKSCIEMRPDAMGYIHPEINQDVCIDCKLCAKTCPANKNIDFKDIKKCYAGWSLDLENKASSTSGGVASVLSQYIIETGGTVYGAVGYGAGIVEHQRAASLEDTLKFKKSKYVQSSINSNLYRQIKEDLRNKPVVLFIGTPCQTAAIRSANANASNLICVDIICHGVPSQQLLRDNIKMILGEDGLKKVTSFSTRDEVGFNLTLFDGDKVLYKKPFYEDGYSYGFYYGLFYRQSCYQCQFAQPKRQTDLTIGDFWGLGSTSYTHKKVSVILVNSNIGAELIDKCSGKLFLDERPVEEAIAGNAQLQHPSSKHKYYNLFRFMYLKFGFSKAIRYCLVEFKIKQYIFKLIHKINSKLRVI